LEISVNIDNLPVNDRTVQALARQLEQIQQSLAALTDAVAWDETETEGRLYSNCCLLVHHPRWYIQAVLAGDRFYSQTDVDRFNAVMKVIDTVAYDDDSDAPFDEVLERELKLISIREVSFTQWSYAADLLGRDREWCDAMDKRHRDRA
jgi:hypothetical protein